MTLDDLILAVVPPGLAIALEFFSLPSDRYLDAKAVEAQKNAALPTAAAAIIGGTAKGAVSMASVSPTLVSVATTAFALFQHEHDALSYILVLVVLVMLTALWAATIFGRFNPFDLITTRLRLPIRLGKKYYLPITQAGLISVMIYWVNALLIALAVLIYLDQLPKW